MHCLLFPKCAGAGSAHVMCCVLRVYSHSDSYLRQHLVKSSIGVNYVDLSGKHASSAVTWTNLDTAMSVIDSLDDDMATLRQHPVVRSLSDDTSVRPDDVICNVCAIDSNVYVSVTLGRIVC